MTSAAPDDSGPRHNASIQLYVYDTSQVGTISEYLPFALSQRLLRRFGVWRLLVFSQASLAVRLLAMSWVTAEHHRLVIPVTQLV